MDDIAQRLEQVRSRIAVAASAAGRAPESVHLIAVSKTKPVNDIRAAFAAGQRDFGENYVQELELKAAELSDLEELRFHFIGHLQRNKAKIVVCHAHMLHTVDSVRLVHELEKRVPAAKAPLRVLVEVNVGDEAQKSGVAPGEVAAVLDAVDAAQALQLLGLMTVPPWSDEPRDTRRYFDALSALRDRAGGAARLPELSMGMSADLEHAIAAGATYVRVGTAIFGERAPK
jgi:hypothetical protein